MPNVDGMMIREQGQEQYTFHPGTSVNYNPAPNLEVRLAGPVTNLAGIVIETAPSVTANPTITGSSTIGSILGGTNGSATGNPTPTASIAWERNGTLIAGQNGGALPTTGFAVGDAIVRVVTWSAIIDGQTVTAEARSAPFTLTEQPTLQVLDITTPLVAGQPASVTFNSAPDTVTGNVTFAGAGATRTFTAPSGTLTIGATLAGYTSFSQTYPVQPAPAALAVTADNTAQITGLTASAPVQIGTPDDATDTLDGTYTVDPADGTTGPEWIAGPWLTRDGTALRLQRGAIVVDGATLTSVTHTWPDGSTGATWTHRPQDAGTTVSVTINAVDSLGREGTATVSLAIPAAGLATGATEIGLFGGGTGTTSSSVTISIDTGPADPAKVLRIFALHGANASSAKVTINGTEYPSTYSTAQSVYQDTGRLIYIEIPCPAGGVGTLTIGNASLTDVLPAAWVFATKGVARPVQTGDGINKDGWSRTDLSPYNRTIGATQPGDIILRGLGYSATDAAGIWSDPTLLTELHDAPANGRQLWIGKGTETAASTNRNLTITPNQVGNYCSIAVILRASA